MNIKSCKVKNAKIWQTLILHNCLPLGEHARFTSKNVAQYLLGSRNDYNLFKFNEIKHLLLKFTPLIETLFRSKVVLGYKVGSVRRVRYCKPVPPNDPNRYQEWYAKMKNVKIAKHHIAYYYKTLENKRPVKILFASTNPTYTDIIKTSAGICQMTASTNRWLCGYITANSQSLGQQLKVSKELNTFTSKSNIGRQFEKTFSDNKEAKEKRYNWHNLNMLTQRPALAIIPDIANNDMILRETIAKTIPVIGLVNSNESTRIAYPIFGNSDSVQIVHFFCNFLAVLIAKTFAQVEYKQSSHRIFNRTRAFINNRTKKTKTTSVDVKSKSQILAQSKTFPWIKKRLRFKKRPKIKLKYAKNPTRQATKRSLYNLARYHRKKAKKLRRLLNKNIKSTEANVKKVQDYKKLKYVGQRPYWKNLRTMMYLLAKSKQPRKFSSKWYKLQWQLKGEELRKLRNPKLETKKTTSENIGEMIKAKQEKRSIHNLSRYHNFLMNKFTAKLHKLLNDKKISLSSKKFEKRIVLRTLKSSSRQIAKLKKRVIGKSRVRRPKFFKRGYLWKLAKKNKRKALIKAYGHSHLIDRSKRNRVQWYAKFQTRKKRKFQLWKRKSIFAKEIKRVPWNKREERITKILETIVQLKATRIPTVQKNKTFQKLYMALKSKKIQATNLKNFYEHKKNSKVAKSIWRSPKLFKAMVKKYPYYTLLARNLFSERRPSLSKTAFKVLAYELNNRKYNPYAFSSKNLYRKQKISNSILWQKLYYKNWIIKWKKKRFAEIPKKHVFFITSKIKKRRLIGPSRTTNMYYFRKKLHLSNSRNFPTYIKRIRKSFNKHILKSSQIRTKSVKFYRRRIRRFIYKFRRFHQILPSLAHRFKPYRKNYRRRYKRKGVKNKFMFNNKQRGYKKQVVKKKQTKQPLFWKNKKANRSKRKFTFVANFAWKKQNKAKNTKVLTFAKKQNVKSTGSVENKTIKNKSNKVPNVTKQNSNVNVKKSSSNQNQTSKVKLQNKEVFVAEKTAKDFKKSFKAKVNNKNDKKQ